jgi:tetratricopeptide (TPR) repeat protein
MNTPEGPRDNEQATASVEQAVELTVEGKYSEALPIFEQHLMTLSEGTINDKRVAASAFSYYGLCVAAVKRRYSEGVKYCEISLRSNPMSPEHRANLALVYIERNDRAKAVESLNAGLRLEPRNRRIHRILNELGRRRPPVISLLGRDNPLNVWLGKRRSQK